MEKKEKRKKISDLSYKVEIMDESIDYINKIMEEMVEDDVESEFSQIMYLWDHKKDVIIGGTTPLVSYVETNTPPDPQEPPEVEVRGMQVGFIEPLKTETLAVGSIGINNTMMIKILTYMKKLMAAEQAKLDKQLTKLIQE